MHATPPGDAPMTEPFVTNPSGLKYLDIQAGSGATAQPGQKATVHYTGWLTTGQKFDSSVDRRGSLSSLTLGAGQVIKGWDEGVTGDESGRKAEARDSARDGRWCRGAGGVIPPNAELIFEVELLGLR